MSGKPPLPPDGRPRRSKARPEVEMPTGYRSTRRAARAKRAAKRAAREQKLLYGWDRVRKTVKDLGYLALVIGGGLFGIALAFILIAAAINGIARWNAKRSEEASAAAQREKASRENLLVIGMEKGEPVGFLAIRIDAENEQVFGVAIPDGAFIEVPGQGFERVGDSLAAGADVAASAVSNYLGVPFDRYMLVPASAYRFALKEQDVRGLADDPDKTNMDDGQLKRVQRELSGVKQQNVALVPLPTKPIKVGDQTYFEPQKDEVADLLKSWWGVDAAQRSTVPRVIVYNGAGVPGIAGKAAQQLIRAGVRVVDTKNADRFDYRKTRIVVQRGDAKVGEEVRKVLGVGEVVVQPSDQDVADVIVVIGKDYRPKD